MKEHPDYKYRPRRKPKSGGGSTGGSTNGSTGGGGGKLSLNHKEPARYSSYSMMETSAAAAHHHHHLTQHHLPGTHVNPSSSLPSFTRNLFAASAPEIGSPSTPSVDVKTATERAELNYSRLLFASQLPSLHLGFATLAGHPLHTAVQIPWPYHHYSMEAAAAAAAFNSPLHQMANNNNNNLLQQQQQHKAMRIANQSILTSGRKSSASPDSQTRPRDGGISPTASGSRPGSSSSYESIDCSSSAAAPASNTSPGPLLPLVHPPPPPPPPSMAAAAAAALFPFYGAYPSTPGSTAPHFGCNCSPLCVTMNHHHHESSSGNRQRCPPQLPTVL